MLHATGNIFLSESDAICITTNGYVRKDGKAVMGRGCARQAALLYPDLPRILGRSLLRNGNRCVRLCTTDESSSQWLVSFPVKPAKMKFNGDSQVVKHMRRKFKYGYTVPGWACIADIKIIERSAHQLVDLADKYGWEDVALPRPGCGAGELDWDDVRPILDSILDNRFTSYDMPRR